MAAIISIILSPAHISLSIAKPTKVSKADQEDTQRYNFTLVAQNRSPHMAVVYGALSAEIWYSETAWVPAAVVDWSPLQDGTTRQKPTNIEFSAEYWQSEQRSTPPTASSSSSGGGQSAPAASTDETDWSNCTVLVTATVWFRYRSWISTRSYDVRANCSPVNFVMHKMMIKADRRRIMHSAMSINLCSCEEPFPQILLSMSSHHSHLISF